jgi:hypothetical protein
LSVRSPHREARADSSTTATVSSGRSPCRCRPRLDNSPRGSTEPVSVRDAAQAVTSSFPVGDGGPRCDDHRIRARGPALDREGTLDRPGVRARLRHRRHRLDRGQHRLAGHRPRPARRLRDPAMDRDRLHLDARLADPARRLLRGQVRTQARIRDRRRVVRGGVSTVRARAEQRLVDRRPSPARCRRRACHTGQPGHHPGQASPTPTGPRRSAPDPD